MAGREGFTESEKKTMLLSPETATGLKLTGNCYSVAKLTLVFYAYVIFVICSEVIHTADKVCSVTTKSATPA